jgi:hypothetical protein
LTYFLVLVGLLLVIFVHPPIRLRSQQNARHKPDWRPMILTFFLVGLTFLFASIPLAQDAFQLTHLLHAGDYAIVLVSAGVWALTLGLVFFLMPPAAFLQRGPRALQMDPSSLEEDINSPQAEVLSQVPVRQPEHRQPVTNQCEQ